MSYRYRTSPYEPAPQAPSASRIMIGLVAAFVLLSLFVLLAGRVPFPPTPSPVQGDTYRRYVEADRALLSDYGYTVEGRVHIPIDLAIDLIAQRGLPVRENPSPTP